MNIEDIKDKNSRFIHVCTFKDHDTIKSEIKDKFYGEDVIEYAFRIILNRNIFEIVNLFFEKFKTHISESVRRSPTPWTIASVSDVKVLNLFINSFDLYETTVSNLNYFKSVTGHPIVIAAGNGKQENTSLILKHLHSKDTIKENLINPLIEYAIESAAIHGHANVINSFDIENNPTLIRKAFIKLIEVMNLTVAKKYLLFDKLNFKDSNYELLKICSKFPSLFEVIIRRSDIQERIKEKDPVLPTTFTTWNSIIHKKFIMTKTNKLIEIKKQQETQRNNETLQKQFTTIENEPYILTLQNYNEVVNTHFLKHNENNF